MTIISKQHDIAIVHFPYVGSDRGKKRPVVVVSNHDANVATGVAVVAMITRADAPGWHGDIKVMQYERAGLRKPCKIRMKFHTMELSALDHVGRLEQGDRDALTAGLKKLLAL